MQIKYNFSAKRLNILSLQFLENFTNDSNSEVVTIYPAMLDKLSPNNYERYLGVVDFLVTTPISFFLIILFPGILNIPIEHIVIEFDEMYELIKLKLNSNDKTK